MKYFILLHFILYEIYYFFHVKTFNAEALDLMTSLWIKHKREQGKERERRAFIRHTQTGITERLGAVARYERNPDFMYLFCSGT